MSNIIVLNLLISIIGDSYDKVQSEKAFFDAQQKFGMLSELNDIALVYIASIKTKVDNKIEEVTVKMDDLKK